MKHEDFLDAMQRIQEKRESGCNQLDQLIVAKNTRILNVCRLKPRGLRSVYLGDGEYARRPKDRSTFENSRFKETSKALEAVAKHIKNCPHCEKKDFIDIALKSFDLDV